MYSLVLQIDGWRGGGDERENEINSNFTIRLSLITYVNTAHYNPQLSGLNGFPKPYVHPTWHKVRNENQGRKRTGLVRFGCNIYRNEWKVADVLRNGPHTI